MSLGTPTPTEPTIATNRGTLVPGLASTFRGSINAYVGGIEDKVQYVQAYLEERNELDGDGWVSGGTVAAGAGLSATITTLEAVVGNYIATANAGTVGSLAANNTNYIYLRQDGTFEANTAGTAPSNSDGHGRSIRWGYAVTDGSDVTSVSNERRFSERSYGGSEINYDAGGTVTLTVAQFSYPAIAFAGTAEGTVVVRMPAQAYHGWDIINQGSATLAFAGSSGGSAEVSTLKAARIIYDGTNYRLMAAEV